MVLHALIRRVAWYGALVVLTGAVVLAARERRPASTVPHGEAAVQGRALPPDAARLP
jgi:hypothetical protein